MEDNKQLTDSSPMRIQYPMTVGDEFVAWAEIYWRIDEKFYPDNEEWTSWKPVREIFIDKINELIETKLRLQSLTTNGRTETTS